MAVPNSTITVALELSGLNSNATVTANELVSQTVVSMAILKGEKGDKGEPATNLVLSVAGKTGDILLDKTDVGLTNVDNTSDADKPVSTAQAAALALKVAKDELVINVKDHGAVGDGVTNDTLAFQAVATLINANGGGSIYIPKGTYTVGSQTFAGALHKAYSYLGATVLGITNCTSPVKIIADGAKVQFASGLKFGCFDPVTGASSSPALPFTNPDYQASIGYFINAVGNVSVSIVGDLEVDGNMAGAVLGGQYGDTGYQCPAYGVRLANNKNVYTANLYAHHSCLDNLYIGQTVGYDGTERRPVTLVNVRCEYAARQAFSLTGGNGFVIMNSKFNYSGTGSIASAPMSGVDIEAELGVIRNATFINCEFVGNASAGMLGSTGDSADIRFVDCKMTATTGFAVSVAKPRYQFSRCTIAGGIVSTYGSSTSPQDNTAFSDCYITDEAAVCGGASPSRTVFADTGIGTRFSHCTIVNESGKYVSLTSAVLDNCNLVHKAGTESVLVDKGIAWIINAATLTNTTVTENITNIPTFGYYLSTSSNTLLVGTTNLVSATGLLKWVSWDTSAGGYTGQGDYTKPLLFSSTSDMRYYNTLDQTTNYERVRHYWNSNIYNIVGEVAGAGATRAINISATPAGVFKLNTSSANGFIESNGSSSTINAIIHRISGALTASSGVQYGLSVNATVNQTGTAGVTDLLVNRAQTAVGSGVQLLADFQLGSTSKAKIDTSGNITGNNLSGTNTGDQTTVSGNSGSATILQTARNINGVSFNGSADITVADSTRVLKAGDNMSGSLGLLATSGTPTHTLTLGSLATGTAIYNTSDQITNYERLRMLWSSNIYSIFTEFAGTGTQREMRLSAAGSTTSSYLKLATTSVGGLIQSVLTSGTASAVVHSINGALSASSGIQYGLSINPTLSQTSTAGYTMLLVNPTETGTGSGTKLLADFQVGGTSKVSIKNDGVIFPVQAPTASAPTYVKGGIYFDTTLNKLRVGGATAWETVTSV